MTFFPWSVNQRTGMTSCRAIPSRFALSIVSQIYDNIFQPPAGGSRTNVDKYDMDHARSAVPSMIIIIASHCQTHARGENSYYYPSSTAVQGAPTVTEVGNPGHNVTRATNNSSFESSDVTYGSYGTADGTCPAYPHNVVPCHGGASRLQYVARATYAALSSSSLVFLGLHNFITSVTMSG
jgi:hypothetical protein